MSELLNVLTPPPTQCSPWYEKGLNFKCTECGQCCSGAPGYVWVNQEEIADMANYLNLSVQEFSSKYLRKVDGRWSLTEKMIKPDG